MKLTYDSSALSEIENAAAWYEAERHGLAREFLAEFNASVRRLLEYPNAWPQVGTRVRRLQLRRFPYGIIYQIRARYSSLQLPTCTGNQNTGKAV